MSFTEELFTDTLDDNLENLDHNIDTGVLIDEDNFDLPSLEYDSDNFETIDFFYEENRSESSQANDSQQSVSEYESENDDSEFRSTHDRILTPYPAHDISSDDQSEDDEAHFNNETNDETLSADEDDTNPYFD